MNNQDSSKKVMQEIQRRGLKMRPRLYFVGGSVLLGLGLAGAIIVSTFFLNLFVFHLRVRGPLAYLQLGPPGVLPFVATFPWAILFLSVVSIAGGLTLLKRYEFSYKMNFAVLAIVLIVVAAVLGFLLDRVGFNERVAPHPPLRRFYRNYFDEDFRHPLPPPEPRVKDRPRLPDRPLWGV
jgi:hypothetical protein